MTADPYRLLTPKAIEHVSGLEFPLAARWSVSLAAAAARFEIVTPKRAADFLAQLAHESALFARVVENLNYSARGLLATWPTRFNEATAAALARKPEAIANHVYGGRNGNVNPGDGWLHRGRGPIMLTFRDNYRKAGDALGLPLEQHPELVEDPPIGCQVAGWYWQSRELAALSDAGDFEAQTRRINGGLIGIEDRLRLRARARVAMGIDP